ncbi:MAG: hypothetical protein QY309_14735 [Cyclobacteriaceae bacterium]|nr:MAG: hypothetical protein QY309_14735 [Cyclobacteriaceae bacterium]
MNKLLGYIASKAIIILSVLLLGFVILKSLTSLILTNAERSSDKLERDQIILETKLDSIQNIKIETQAQDSTTEINDSSLANTHLKFKKQIEDERKTINHLIIQNLITQREKNEKILGLLDIFEMCGNVLGGTAVLIIIIGFFWRK